MKRTSIALILVLSLFIFGETSVLSKSGSTPTAKLIKKNVLFIGNSYTYVNNLPDIFKKLALSGGYDVTVDSSAFGGYTLLQHSDPADRYGKITLNKIKSKKWDFVILQEQSQHPAYANLRENMYAGARKLDKVIKSNNSKPVFLLTWGYKNGDKLNSNVESTQTFEGMQEQLNIGYEAISKELSDDISPVGIAWLNVKKKYPNINLWANDDSHPSKEGSYLAACVMYASLFKKSPVGLKYTFNIPVKTAALLQKAANDTCFAK